VTSASTVGGPANLRTDMELDALFPFALRICKAFILGLVMFFSMHSLGFSIGASLAASLTPTLLGALGIFTAQVYGLTALVLIAACAVTILPETPMTKANAEKLTESVVSGATSAAQKIQATK